MPTTDLSQLSAAFADEEYQHFEGRGGKTMTYVEDETVMDRLDQVLGVGNWQISAEPVPVYEGVVKVRLGVLIGGEWRWYEDFGYPNRPGHEDLKQAMTDGIRRCGRYLGIARDLYRKDAAPLAEEQQNGHSAPRSIAPPPRSTTAIPESLDDLDFENLSPTRPVAVTSRGEGVMWSKQLFELAEQANVDKRTISDTAKKMYGKDKWKVTDLTDGERYALAVELELA